MIKMIRNIFLKGFLDIRVTGVLLLLAYASALAAQAGIGASGGHATSEEIRFSYSVGQVFNNVVSDPKVYVSQGIQHPMLLIVSETRVPEKKAVGIKIYPNPAADQLHIEHQVPVRERCRVLLLNMQGQVLTDRTFDGTEFVLSLETIGAGNYLLKVIPGTSEPKTFNIIKAK